MMKSLLKLKVEDGKVKGEIEIKDLVFLFENYPENFDGNKPLAMVKKGKEEAFAKSICEWLLEVSANERDCVRWAEPIEDIFHVFLEGDESFLMYND